MNRRFLQGKYFWIILTMILLVVFIVTVILNPFIARLPLSVIQSSISPSSPPASLVTAEDFFEQGNYDYDTENYDQAIMDYTRAVALNPQFAEAYNNRAYTYMILNRYDLALPDLNEAIRIRPDYFNALMNRGDIYNYYYRIDRAKAVADYNLAYAIQADPNIVCGHRLLAVHNGWNLSVLGELLTRGMQSGCPPGSSH